MRRSARSGGPRTSHAIMAKTWTQWSMKAGPRPCHGAGRPQGVADALGVRASLRRRAGPPLGPRPTVRRHPDEGDRPRSRSLRGE
jgi:hypothetical protein